VVRFDSNRNPELFLSGLESLPRILASRAVMVCTNNALFRVDAGIAGRRCTDAGCGDIAAGSELLTPQRVDTNSLHLTDQLMRFGIEVVRKTVVGDDRDRLTVPSAERWRAPRSSSSPVVWGPRRTTSRARLRLPHSDEVWCPSGNLRTKSRSAFADSPQMVEINKRQA